MSHILITRDAASNQDLKKALEEQGHQVFCYDSFTVEYLRPEFMDCPVFDVVVFPSVLAVKAFLNFFSVRALHRQIKHVVCVGHKTKTYLSNLGVEVTAMPSHEQTAKGLLQSDFWQGQSSKVFLVQAQDGREELFKTLNQSHDVTHWQAYKKIPLPVSEDLEKQIKSKNPDWVLFFAPSAEQNLSQNLNKTLLKQIKKSAHVAVIGSTTKEHALKQGWNVQVVSGLSTQEDLLKHLSG